MPKYQQKYSQVKRWYELTGYQKQNFYCELREKGLCPSSYSCVGKNKCKQYNDFILHEKTTDEIMYESVQKNINALSGIKSCEDNKKKDTNKKLLLFVHCDDKLQKEIQTCIDEGKEYHMKICILNSHTQKRISGFTITSVYCIINHKFYLCKTSGYISKKKGPNGNTNKKKKPKNSLLINFDIRNFSKYPYIIEEKGSPLAILLDTENRKIIIRQKSDCKMRINK